MNIFLIYLGKLLSRASATLNLGSGSTWPGHIALLLNKKFISQVLQRSRTKIIFVAGTNGKTTTSAMLTTILSENDKQVLHNVSGANLLNGIASTIIRNADNFGTINADFAIFELDENALPSALKELSPDYLLLLNLFRDQLDRYGEVHTIAGNWKKSISELAKPSLIVNADDPEISYMVDGLTNAQFFGMNGKNSGNKTHEHASDSTYCPRCGEKLQYRSITFSHLGDWRCSKCNLHRPTPQLTDWDTYPLPGMYNKYNTLAAATVAKQLGIADAAVKHALKHFTPAFGRQELLEVDGKKAQIFLSKNPTGFNESLRTIKEMGAKNILLILNDGIADGTDVSWIWDIDMNILLPNKPTVFISGDRAFDMALRIKYESNSAADHPFFVEEDIGHALRKALKGIKGNEILFILPTYTAMLSVRKILTGRRIL